MKPIFSIILPTYNRSDKISCAIDSVRRQKEKSWELIIVDDGGTDNTRDIVETYNDKRIRYYWKENEERSIARNFGIDKSNGIYVCFLDSDDIYLKNHLSEAYIYLKRTQSCNVLFMSYATYVLDERSKKTFRMDQMDIINSIFKGKNIASTNSVVIRRDALEQVQFTPSRNAVIGEDWSLWLKLYARHKIHTCNTVTSVILEHSGRSINTTSPGSYEKSMNDILEDLRIDKELRKYIGEYRFRKIFYFTKMRIGTTFITHDKKLIKKGNNYIIESILKFPVLLFKKHFLIFIRENIYNFFNIKYNVNK